MAPGDFSSVILLLLLLLLAIGAASFLGWLCLGPINRLAGRLQARTRFQLSDFFWLLIHAQLALAYCVRFVGREQRFFFPVMLSFLTLAVSGMWAGSLSCLSRAGVTHPPRRAVFVLFIVPLTLSIMMIAAIGLIAVVGSFLFHQIDMTKPMQIGTTTFYIPYHPYSTSAMLACMPFVGLAIRRVSTWVASNATLPGNPPSPNSPREAFIPAAASTSSSEPTSASPELDPLGKLIHAKAAVSRGRSP